MLWLWLALSSALLSTILVLLMRVLAVKSQDPRAFSFLFNCLGAFFALIIALFELQTAKFPHIGLGQILLICLVGLFYGIYERFQFLARKAIDASTITILFRLTPAIAFTGSLIFLGESLTFGKLVGALLIFTASFLVIRNNHNFKYSKMIILAVFLATVVGLGWMFDKPASYNIPTGMYTLLIWMLPLAIIVFPGIKLKALRKELEIGSWKIVLMALINISLYYLQLKALALTDASKVIPIASSSSILTVIGGIFFLGETTYMGRKLFAGLLTFIGIILLR